MLGRIYLVQTLDNSMVLALFALEREADMFAAAYSNFIAPCEVVPRTLFSYYNETPGLGYCA